MKSRLNFIVGISLIFTQNLIGQEAKNATQNLIYNEQIEIANLKDINTEALDFSPIQYKDGIVFTSNRPKTSKSKNKLFKKSYTDLYYSELQANETYSKPIPLAGKVNSIYHDGTATFDQDGTKMYFTRNDDQGQNENGVIVLKIYSAEFKRGKWVNVTSLSINNDRFSNCHPTLSADGTKLYFASDRPKGYGGMDIYVSINKNGEWQQAINLGPAVNSVKNEVFPFVDHNDILYFSSNRKSGFGGLDLYLSNKEKKNIETSWTQAQGLGTPFNSDKDDFGLVMNKNGQSGYFNSSRRGGEGEDDIYFWSIKEKEFPLANKNINEESKCALFVGSVFDNKRMTEVQHAEVKMLDKCTGEYSEMASNEKGVFEYCLPCNCDFEFSIQKENYKEAKITISTQSIACTNPEPLAVTIPLSPTNYEAKPFAAISTPNVATAADLGLLPSTKEEIAFINSTKANIEKPDNNATKSSLEKEEKLINNTKSISSKKYENLDVDIFGNPIESKEIASSKKIVAEVSAKVEEKNTKNSESVLTETITPVSKPINNNAIFAAKPSALESNPKPLGSASARLKTKEEKLSKHFLGNAKSEFESGQVINLNDIYYKFNKFNLLENSKTELDRVVDLLLTYPDMEIEIIAHTDVRGKANYNLWLSRKRAQAAAYYIVSKGISFHRIKAIGMGETRLLNACLTATDCSDEEHQLNRRTEIRISQFSKDVNRYINAEVVSQSPESTSSLKEGHILKLKNIHYGINQHSLNHEAKTELDHIVKLLKLYPSMQIMVMSHTDAVGRSSTNRALSQKRANTVVEYVVSKGISKRRLTSLGLGENQLLKDCNDYSSCTSANKENRRTEIRITKLDAPDAVVIYN